MSAAVGWSLYPAKTLLDEKPDFILKELSDLLDIL